LEKKLKKIKIGTVPSLSSSESSNNKKKKADQVHHHNNNDDRPTENRALMVQSDHQVKGG
jgi:hypothetical protein